MASCIRCCYRGCAIDVWAPVDGQLAVDCSSATCISCRRVALCLEHFGAVYQSQGHLGCPNCHARRWHVVLFGADTLDPALEQAVTHDSGHIEHQRPVTAPPEPIVARPLPTAWTLLGYDTLADGERTVGPIKVRRVGAHDLVHLHPDEDPSLVDGLLSEIAFAPDGKRSVMMARRAGKSALTWSDTDRTIGELPNTHGLINHSPAFLDNWCFVYIASLPNGRTELREASFEGGGRLTTRHLERAPDHLPPGHPTAVFDSGRHVLLFQAHPEGTLPLSVRLADGAKHTLGGLTVIPRAASGAAEAPVVAWITGEGSVRVAGPARAEVAVGQSDGETLALSDDGRQVAWHSDGVLHIASVETGDTERWPLARPIHHIEFNALG